MKKIFILIISLFIVLLHTDIKAATAKKIDLKTKEDEVNIIFLKLKGSTSLLVSDLNKSQLFFIDYKNSDGIDKVMSIFNIKPEMFWLDKSTSYSSNISIKKDKFTTVDVNNHNICIVKNLTEAEDCEFIYLLSLNDEFNVDEETLSVFYDEDIKDEYLLELNESWVDSHIVSLDSFTILKLNKEEYNILVVPLANK